MAAYKLIVQGIDIAFLILSRQRSRYFLALGNRHSWSQPEKLCFNAKIPSNVLASLTQIIPPLEYTSPSGNGGKTHGKMYTLSLIGIINGAGCIFETFLSDICLGRIFP